MESRRAFEAPSTGETPQTNLLILGVKDLETAVRLIGRKQSSCGVTCVILHYYMNSSNYLMCFFSFIYFSVILHMLGTRLLRILEKNTLKLLDLERQRESEYVCCLNSDGRIFYIFIIKETKSKFLNARPDSEQF